jgi:hypothetical protein
MTDPCQAASVVLMDVNVVNNLVVISVKIIHEEMLAHIMMAAQIRVCVHKTH